MRFWIVFALCCGVLSCGGSANQSSTQQQSSGPPPAPSAADPAQIQILFIGNSHSASHDLPNLVEDLINFNLPEKTALAERVQPYNFLIDLAVSETTLEHLASRK